MKQRVNSTIKNIFLINFKIRITEKVLVFTDAYNRKIEEIAKKVSEMGKEFTKELRYMTFHPTGCHGTEPPEEIWREAFGKGTYMELKELKLMSPLLQKKTSEKQNRKIEKIIREHRKDAVNAVIALSYFSTSHTKFRNYLSSICGARYASMPLFDEAMLEGAMSVDWDKMKKRTHSIARAVNQCEQIEITTPNGTLMNLSKKDRKAKADTGIITKPGEFSNLPAGEVYLAPREGTARGSLVLEWAPTRKLKTPITLTVDRGMVKEVRGKEKYATYLREKLAENRENANIAELGIGTNNRATRPDNILESEKILGTIHVALGDNSTFGGKVSTSFHQDFIFFKPTVTLICKNGRRTTLIKKGKIVQALIQR